MVKGPAKASERSIKISKGIIFSFLTFYFIFYGIVLSAFIDYISVENPGALPIFVAYIPLLCYVGAIFMGLRTIIYIRQTTEQKSRQKKSVKRKGKSSIYKQSLFLLIIVFVFIPLLSPIVDRGENDQNFSIYNQSWNGASEFRQYLIDDGYEVGCIQSSLSATERLNKSVLLVLLGPNSFYNPLYEIPYFVNFLQEGGNSLLLCHDHGSTSTLLYEILVASLLSASSSTVPIAIFPDGYLRDNASCLTDPNNPDMRNPLFPIIKDFPSHSIDYNFDAGVDNVILSRSSISIWLFTLLAGWDVIGQTTQYGFLDRNNDGIYNGTEDGYTISTSMRTALKQAYPEYAGIIDALPVLPTGGIPQPVFMAKDLGDTRIFVSSDASVFNNELINEAGYDNLRFAENIIDWLTPGDKDDWIVVFDEAHIRPEFTRDLTSAGIFGFIMQYIVHLSTNPITAWIYPLLAIYTFRKYIPKRDDEKEQKKKEKKEEQKEEQARFRTSSFFAQKIEWYHEKNKFHKALTLLYRRLERKLNAQLGGRPITTENVIELVRAKEGRLSKQKEKKLTSFMDKMLAIKKGKMKVKRDDEFEKLFYKMEWAASIL